MMLCNLLAALLRTGAMLPAPLCARGACEGSKDPVVSGAAIFVLHLRWRRWAAGVLAVLCRGRDRLWGRPRAQQSGGHSAEQAEYVKARRLAVRLEVVHGSNGGVRGPACGPVPAGGTIDHATDYVVENNYMLNMSRQVARAHACGSTHSLHHVLLGTSLELVSVIKQAVFLSFCAL